MANQYKNKVIYNGSVLVDLTGDTAVAADVRSGKTFHLKSGAPATGTIADQAAQTLYPKSTDQTVAAGKYLAGAQTFKAVAIANLSAGNVKTGVTVKVGDAADDDRVASVTGTFTAASTISSGQTAATAASLRTGYSAFINGAEIKGTIANQGASTLYPSTSDQVVAAGKYLSGAQTFKAVVLTGVSAANIKYGATVKIGDAADDDRITSVTGTFTSSSTVSSGQTAAAAGQIVSGYSAWVNGTEVKGTLSASALVSGVLTASATGSATISSLSFSYNSTSGKFDTTGSASISGTANAGVSTAGLVTTSTTKTGSTTGTASVSAAVTKIVGSTTITGTKVVTPVIARTSTSASGATNVGTGSATTTPPTSGYFVSVQSAANTGTLTATPGVTTAGYGTAANHGIAAGTETVGANQSAVTYVTVPTGGVGVKASATGIDDATGYIYVTLTRTAGYITAGTPSYNVKQVTTQPATTFTPGTTDQTIATHVWTTGNQTIKGDANLVPENIAKDVTIFGVTGTHEGGGVKVPVFEPVTVPFNTGSWCNRLSFTKSSLSGVSGLTDLFWFHGNNLLYSSPDGTTWTYRGIGGSQNIVQVEYDSGMNRFVTYNGTYVRYSPASNPSSWSNGSTASAMCSLAKGESYFVGLPQPQTYTQAGGKVGVTSVNGTIFANNTSLMYQTMSVYDVTPVHDVMVAVGTYYSNLYIQAFKPIANSGFAGSAVNLGGYSTYGYPMRVVYDEAHRRIAVLTSFGYVTTSTTYYSGFSTPTKINPNALANTIWTDMIYAFGILIAVGAYSNTNTYISYSEDGGVTWTAINFPYAEGMGSTGPSYIGNHRMAVGANKIILAPASKTTLYVADMS